MAAPITVELQAPERLTRTLARMEAVLGNLRPVFLDVGEQLLESTRQRFVSQTGPDGKPWAPNAQSTLDAYLGRLLQKRDKQGKVTGRKTGAAAKSAVGKAAGKKILQGHSRSLMDTLHYVATRNSLTIGSPMSYSAMQQFGGEKARFPNLWGDIPARPFLGLSLQDELTVLEILQDHLDAATQ